MTIFGGLGMHPPIYRIVPVGNLIPRSEQMIYKPPFRIYPDIVGGLPV